MALQYVFDSDAPLRRKPVTTGEVIAEGELVVENDDGTIARLDPSSDAIPNYIVVHDPRGDAIVEHDEDYVDYEDLWEYDGDAGDRAYVAPLEQVDAVLPRAIDEQTSPASSEPSLTEGTVVGAVVLGSGETRVVPEGYSYDTTTYNESNNNFVALGRVDHDNLATKVGDIYGRRIPVRLDADQFHA
jgi:hypothetical protein